MASSSRERDVELAALCLEMDRVLVEYFQRIERYQELHSKSIKHITSGYLAITKARLTTGGIHIKTDLTLEPQSAVSCDFLPGDDKNNDQEGRYSHRRVVYEAPKSENRDETLDSTPTRKRLLHEDIRDDPTSSSDSSDDNRNKTSNENSSDPIKPAPTTLIMKPRDPFTAFGFMARTPLKPAQTQFSSALSLLVDAADTIQEIKLLQRKYMALQKRKSHLQQASDSS